MSDQAKPLVQRLRELATGYYEWRVQDPKTRCYCAVFDAFGERQAREWLDDHKRRYPSSDFAAYEVARVHVMPERDELMQLAAAEIERLQAHDAERGKG